jgi:hypothetical protein
LTARRGDGEEFLVEATLSPLEIEGQHFYTVILRDVTERWHSEETLKQLQLENLYLQEEIKTRQSPDHIVGDSPAMQEVFAHAEQVAGTDSTVLLTGDRHRQERHRAGDSRPERPAGQAIRQRQLRRPAWRIGGKRVVRP